MPKSTPTHISHTATHNIHIHKRFSHTCIIIYPHMHKLFTYTHIPMHNVEAFEKLENADDLTRPLFNGLWRKLLSCGSVKLFEKLLLQRFSVTSSDRKIKLLQCNPNVISKAINNNFNQENSISSQPH